MTKPGGNSPGAKGPRAKSAGAESAGADAELPYEQARDQLTEVVRQLENGGLTLEESLELWERGERLAEVCTRWLEGAKARLAAVTPEAPGSAPGAAPF